MAHAPSSLHHVAQRDADFMMYHYKVVLCPKVGWDCQHEGTPCVRPFEACLLYSMFKCWLATDRLGVKAQLGCAAARLCASTGDTTTVCTPCTQSAPESPTLLARVPLRPQRRDPQEALPQAVPVPAQSVP